MQIKRLSAHLGVEVSGIELSRPVAAEVQTCLNQAFLDHSVLVIRDQCLTPHQVLTVAELFGPVVY